MVDAPWSARVRGRDLRLLGEARFSTATLVRNYANPHTLALTGTIDNLRDALQPGYGVLLHDGEGNQKFNGILTGIRRVGTRRAQLLFTSDLVWLWWRACWPSPENAWAGQLAAYDVQTASAETRILSYVSRNAGSQAWRELPGGTAPGSPIFSPLAVLDPTLTYITQAAAPDPDTTDIYVTQKLDDDNESGTPDNLWISRFKDGVQVSQMSLPRGGHGDLFEVRRVKGKVHVVFRYRGLSGANAISGTWVSLPWTGGKTWTATQALAYKIPTQVKAGTNPRPLFKANTFYNRIPPRTNPPARAWFQGEARYGNTFYRMYGKPYDNNGPVAGAMPAIIEVIRNNTIVQTIDISQLGRSGGLPIDGYLEPEGLSTVTRDGQPSLMIGICTGKGAARRHRLYTMPLDPDADDDRLEDRRVPRLRIPVSQGRGESGKTSARFQVLGQLVAELAESADLNVDIVQNFEGFTPWLDFQVTETPDLSDTFRIGTAGEGGPIVVGEEWDYNLEVPAVTAALSAAGGELTARILNSRINFEAQALWNARIEAIVDQRDSTDPEDIKAGIDQALLDGAGTTEISVPVTVLDDNIPLGARAGALLDGELVSERIRQITTEIKNQQGEARIKTTAILGSPDAGIKSPTQKRLAKMLRRLQTMEAR